MKYFMTKERFKMIAAVYLLFLKDGQVLLQRRAHTGYEDGNYSLPAGHVDGNETARATMLREAVEEVGVSVRQDDLAHVLTLHRWCGDHERIELFFSTTQWEGELQIMEPDKHDDLRWFPIDELPDNTIPYIGAVIQGYQEGKTYLEFGW